MRTTPFGPIALALLVSLPLLAGGCATYEFDLVQPPELARHIGRSAEEVVHVDPLDYRFRAVENRLVMVIANPTDDPITLLGPQSYVVSPNGQSHPLRSQTIAPHTYIRLILPPMRPYYYNPYYPYGYGPTFGIGMGVGYTYFPHHDYHHRGHRGHRGRTDDPGPPHAPPDAPSYFAYYDDPDPTYWDWKGESDVRVHLVYQRGTNQKTFSDDFTFHRKKM